MGRPCLAALLFALTSTAQPPNTLSQALNRISEEAELFAREAPLMLSEETLHQKALRSNGRFRPRVGADALKPVPLVYQERLLVSEYGFAPVKEAGGALREMRRVVSVDDKKIESVEKARQTLTFGLKSDDERARKKLIQDFEKHGLIGAAVDFGQILLEFRRRNLGKFDFTMKGQTRSGPDDVQIIGFRQKEGPGELTIYQGNSANRVELTGEIWVRVKDLLPVRVILKTEQKNNGTVTIHTAAVDYDQTPFGPLAPVAVRHQEVVNRVLKTENRYEYKPFRKFAASAEIKFTEVPEMPK
jgi:hypothetical protein